MEIGNVSFAGKKPGRIWIFTGIWVWLGMGFASGLIWSFWTFLVGQANCSPVTLSDISWIFSLLSWVGLVLFWIGVEIAGSHWKSYGLKGRVWARIGLLLLIIAQLVMFLGFPFFGLGELMSKYTPWSYVIQNCYYIICWSLCAIGFMQFGISGGTDFTGKSAAMLIMGAAWISVGTLAYSIAANLGAPYFAWLASVVDIMCLFLMYIGWRRLFSAWEYGTMEHLESTDTEKIRWKMYAGAVLNGIVLLTLASLAGGIFDTIGSVNNRMDLVKGFMNNDLSDVFMPDGWDVAQWLVLILEIVGYAIYFSGLKQFSTLQCQQDASAVLKVRSGAILTLIGVICGHIPFIGWLVKLVLVIIGFIQMLSGYKSLKNSATFAAPSGAATLHTALIIQLIGVLIGLLPFMAFIECIFDIIVFFMIVSGWSAIKKVTSLTRS